MKIPGFENKEFVFKIEYRIDFDDLVSEGMESVLEEMRGTGSAEVIDVELREKKIERR